MTYTETLPKELRPWAYIIDPTTGPGIWNIILFPVGFGGRIERNEQGHWIVKVELNGHQLCGLYPTRDAAEKAVYKFMLRNNIKRLER